MDKDRESVESVETDNGEHQPASEKDAKRAETEVENLESETG